MRKLELKTAFTRGVGEGLDFAVVAGAATVEHDFRDLLGAGALGHSLADLDGRGDVGGGRLGGSLS